MPQRLRVLAGDCVVTDRGDRTRTHRGRVVVLIKPDDTTLVHDADGYQPVAWLTRPESVVVEGDGDGFTVTARDGSRRLRVVAEEATACRALPVTEAGVPVGTCPDDGGPLVRSRGDVVCLDCETRWGLPAGASVTDATCDDCGLPKIRVERGEPFHLCLDPACDPMEDAVSDRFDRAWDCPDCEGDLRVRSAPGRVYLGCENYPDCETTFSFPAGVVVDECDCGLPVFETAAGLGCLDGSCSLDGYTASGDAEAQRPNDA
ncbi:topoisomerase DNA-binding C4 zinc finger domain-containing protein [Halorubrum distributum]|uniref:topoisomerase DNA-binding C4 zinc finger domain-containing protein n=1 Tax=Halorubrum distributum TaxID=29283 RepID=UPI000A8C26B5|nr:MULTISPECIES: topoisomerase DNA-binding C4 zinc finger domain-containing protein [Halorubrum distributum group]MDV7350337.1 endonuclease NucS [Halorubrum distributum]